MNVVLQTVYQYYKQIPANICMTIGKSAFFSFTVTLCLERVSKEAVGGYTRPLIAMGVAVMAACIHALLTPIFNVYFGNDDQVKLHQEFIKCMIEVSLIKSIVCYATADEMNLQAQKISLISINFIKSLIHTVPSLVSWMDPLGASEIRDYLNDMGLDTPNGQNTTFIVV